MNDTIVAGVIDMPADGTECEHELAARELASVLLAVIPMEAIEPLLSPRVQTVVEQTRAIVNDVVTGRHPRGDDQTIQVDSEPIVV